MTPADWFTLFVGLLAGLYAGYRFGGLLKHPRRPRAKPVPAHVEYWVYLPGTEMPDRDAVMTRMVSGNPHLIGRRSPIGTREGLLFSDVRLHTALVLRSKNPALFRPDATEGAAFAEGTDAQVLEGLAKSQALARIQYVSEKPLPDDRHLTFLPHFADAIAAVGHGLVVYDVPQRLLTTAEGFAERLHRHPTATDLASHVRWSWSPDERAATTFGLVKLGVPEWRTRPAPGDFRTLLGQLLEDALQQQWPHSTVPQTLEVTAYGDAYRLLFSPAPDGHLEVEVYRESPPSNPS